jgi:hypothetical protein
MKTTLLLTLAFILALPSQPRAEMGPEEFLKLAQSYQSGYLQLLAVSAVEVYSTSGLIGTAFSKGQMSGPEAAEALTDTRMLHSVSYSTLLDVQKNTPAEDKDAARRVGQLAAALLAEQQLLDALGDVFSNPTSGNAKRVESARSEVDRQLDELLAQ